MSSHLTFKRIEWGELVEQVDLNTGSIHEACKTLCRKLRLDAQEENKVLDLRLKSSDLRKGIKDPENPGIYDIKYSMSIAFSMHRIVCLTPSGKEVFLKDMGNV